MTPQEAIAILKSKLHLDCKLTEAIDELKAREVAVTALEKQIPKKLICIETEKCCPICKEGICLIGDDGNYGNNCYNCGQALDWSDSNAK